MTAIAFQSNAQRLPVPGVHRRGWYAHVKEWLATAPDVRIARSEQTERDYQLIAELEPQWGRMLDDLGANYRQIRWVANARGLPQRQVRHQALVTFLREGLAGERAFAALRAQCVKTGRAAKREAREREREREEACGRDEGQNGASGS